MPTETRLAGAALAGALLAAAGYAREFTIEPNTRWADEIAHAVLQARSQEIGLWGLCPLRP